MIDANGLKTFKISNGALKNEMLPQRLKFFAWGDNKSTDGNFRAGEKTGAELVGKPKEIRLRTSGDRFQPLFGAGHGHL